MAYNIGDRFPRAPYPYRLLEPGSYQSEETNKFKLNKAPFLSLSERTTQSGNRIWTHAIYHADPCRKIPNCTSLMAKKPRFPYEALSKEDIEAILCKCGLSNVCECSDEMEQNEQENEINCHAKIRRRLYKGPPPRAGSGGLSVPSRRDHGFDALPDGTYKRVYTVESDLGPPFYDAAVSESTAFYRGCKWSHWRSTRAIKSPERRPGPADYNLIRLPSHDEICAEKIREQKRKYSKQLRYIEMIQQKNILENRPGPATYSPYTKDTDLKPFGPKADRFHNSQDSQGPGPAAHWIRRDFDLPKPLTLVCLAKLPEPSFFGVNAKRFKPRKEEGPSPATYSPSIKQCRVLHCSPPPFGTSAIRFKQTVLEDDEDEEIDACTDNKAEALCPKPTWEFKSKTIRMKPLEKKQYEQSPADLAMSGFYPKRSNELQYISPYYSSEGRFQPWYDWLPVFGRLKTPGPGYYNLERYACVPAVRRGPLFRAERFPASSYQGPAPNEYNVGGGVETVLSTHNQRLKQNLENRHKFHWEPSNEPKKLSFEEQETLILDKAIASLDIDSQPKPNGIEETLDSGAGKGDLANDGIKPKLLKCFLNRHPVKPGF